jgi:hypothetical protein
MTESEVKAYAERTAMEHFFSSYKGNFSDFDEYPDAFCDNNTIWDPFSDQSPWNLLYLVEDLVATLMEFAKAVQQGGCK